jgi:hypothetical protein
MQQTLERLRAEFFEMPDLRLTASEIQRFCGIEPMMCSKVLDALVASRFLYVSSAGVYTRLTDAPCRKLDQHGH